MAAPYSCLVHWGNTIGACAGETLPNASVVDLGRRLVGSGYEVFLRDGALYAFKGIAGRFAPIAVHVSLVAILGGAAFGALAGFDGQVMLPEGQEVLVANVLRGAGTALPGIPLPEGAKRVLHLDQFTIDYRADGSIGQFKSLLTERDLDGNELRQKEIYVNEPLRFGGVTAYQARAPSRTCSPYVMCPDVVRGACGCQAGSMTTSFRGVVAHVCVGLERATPCRRTGRCRACASASAATRGG